MISLKNKNMIVCAGSSGIGRGVVEVLSKCNANITTFSRNIEKLNSLKKYIKEETGNDLNIIKADLSKSEDIIKVVKSHHEHGDIDGLVMNYGDPRVDNFLSLDMNDWDYNINMMLKSTILLTRFAAEDMIRKNSGRIIYITSMTTKNPLKNFSISNTLRSGIVALGKTLSIELAPHNITVNSISQGYFCTDRLRDIINKRSEELNKSHNKVMESIKSEIPMNRFGKPEEIGNLVAFLASDLSSYITGDNIQIDGGAVKSI